MKVVISKNNLCKRGKYSIYPKLAFMYEATSTMYQTMNNEHTNIEIKVKH